MADQRQIIGMPKPLWLGPAGLFPYALAIAGGIVGYKLAKKHKLIWGGATASAGMGLGILVVGGAYPIW